MSNEILNFRIAINYSMGVTTQEECRSVKVAAPYTEAKVSFVHEQTDTLKFSFSYLTKKKKKNKKKERKKLSLF